MPKYKIVSNVPYLNNKPPQDTKFECLVSIIEFAKDTYQSSVVPSWGDYYQLTLDILNSPFARLNIIEINY